MNIFPNQNGKALVETPPGFNLDSMKTAWRSLRIFGITLPPL